MSFTCHDIQDRWAEYLYRELEEPDQARFVQHIRRCASCRAEEDQWRGLLSGFDSMAASDGNMQAPPELIFRLRRQIRFYEDCTQSTVAQIRNWTVGAAVACALFLGGAHFLLTRLQSHTTPDAALAPIAQSVLSGLYGQQNLEILSKEGIFDATAIKDRDIAVNVTEEAGKKKGDSAS